MDTSTTSGTALSHPTKTGPREHRFITLSEECLSRAEAEERVLAAIRAYGLKDSKSRIKEHGVTFTDPKGKSVKLAFADLVAGTRRTGVVPELDRDLWRKKAPHGTIFYASDARALSAKLVTGVRTSPEAKMPGCATNDVVPDMIEDVLFYRREAARLSVITQNSYRDCFRAYRAYLGSAVTAIDAFLNGRAWFALNDSVHSWTPDERNTLSNQRMSLNKKLEKWLPILTGGKSLSNTSPAWLEYNKIREARNAYVHVNEPEHIFSLEEAVQTLNLCRLGLGQLLIDIVSLFGENAHPTMLEVRHAPRASFVEWAAK